MKLSAAVVAGGKSTRMRRDKAGLRVRGGSSMLERQFALLKTLRPAELLLSCRHGQFPQNLPGIRQVCDDGNNGPLGALAALLRSCRTDFLLVLAVDLPRISLPTMKKIAGQAIFADGKGAVPRTPRGIEPLAAVYPTRILDLVSRQIRQTSDRSMHALVENGIHSGLLEWYEVGIAEIPRFFNWNHPRPI